MKKRILITDKVHPLLISGLEVKDFDVVYHPKLSYEEVKRIVKEFQGLIINSKVICDRTFLEQAKHLDFIGRLGSGLDIIDKSYASLKNIEIISSPEGNANAVGEHALGMLLNLMNHICQANRDVKQFQWIRERNRGTELSGKTIGIIGFGHTGPAFANKLTGFDVKLMVFDKYRKDIKETFPQYVETDLTELLHNSDVVSIHLPLTEETHQWIDKAFFDQMKNGAIFINTSRGKIVKSSDLLDAMEGGKISGACLDVLENELPHSWSDNEQRVYKNLLERNDVIITPHIAGWTYRSLELIAGVLLEKICKFYQI